LFWSTPITFVHARVLGARGQLARTIRIAGGRVDGLDVAPDRRDVVIDLDDSFVLPGLINAHDHLELNSQPRLKWRERYENATQWFADFQPRFGKDPDLAVNQPRTLDDRVWVGGLKNLLSGVTTVCHHNPMHPVLRRRFPVRVVTEFGYSHSLHVDGPAVARSHRNTPSGWPWMIHAAEGVDASARQEIEMLDRYGCLVANTVLIHGVALCVDDSARVLEAGAGLVWCPSSNDFLFGRTADVRAFDDADRLALGSDSRLSGEGDLLDELKAAHAARQLSAEGLSRTVTTTAARTLRLPDAGRLEVGVPADLLIIRALYDCPFDSLIAATRADVRLTMINGRACVAEPALSAAFSSTGERPMPAMLDDNPRCVAAWIGKHVTNMQLQEPGFEVLH
jgi:cytosine/adenosine deaminase-related metal-dependent hydrolase